LKAHWELEISVSSHFKLTPMNVIYAVSMQMITNTSALNHLGFHAKSLKKSNYKQYIFFCNKYLDLLKLPEQPGLVSGSHAHFAKSTEHCEFLKTCYTFIGEVQDLFLILGSSVLKSAPEGQSAPRVYTQGR